ncbi:MAG: GFA family protein [Pseudomonadota bacterium]
MLTGGCFCGAVRYEASGPVSSQAMCHCTMCRGTSGAPCVAWFTVPARAFKFISGQPTRFRSSGHACRTFCPACGTQLTFADDGSPGEIDVTTCSLDAPAELPLQVHIFTRSQIPWLTLGDGLPRYPGSHNDS